MADYKDKMSLWYIGLELSVHLFATLFLAAVFYFFTAKFTNAILVILGGVFIDFDHFIDYFIYFRNKFNLVYFFRGYFLRSGRVYLFLHSWELIFTLFVLSWATGSSGLFALWSGLAMHLLIDNLQRQNPWVYFLSYRFSKRFIVEELLPEKKAYLTQISALSL